MIIVRLLAASFVGLAIIVFGGPPRAFAQARGWSFGEGLTVGLHRAILACLGVRTRVHGAASSLTPQLVVANHVSWLDIVVLGAMRRSEFLAKKEVGPPGIIGATVALQGVVFVDRGRRRLIPSVNAAMARRMLAGAPMVLFAEATTGDGNRLMPFRSSHFEALRQTLGRAGAEPKIAYVQPLYLAYTRCGGLPIGRSGRPLVAWYGDMEFFSHLWSFVRAGRFDCEIWCGDVIAVDGVTDRKSIMTRAEASVRSLAVKAFHASAQIDPNDLPRQRSSPEARKAVRCKTSQRDRA
jgi:1-acyl-sn-glycerol-3-phosphate acyltransferase